MGESASGTFVRSHSDPPIIDQFGNSWGISRRGQVVIDGVHDHSTAGVTELFYQNRMIWQWVEAQRLWWSKTSPTAAWLPPEGTPDAPFGPTPDPRISTIIDLLGAIKADAGRTAGNLAAGLEATMAAVDRVPQHIPHDPRIDALLAEQMSDAIGTATGIAALASRLDGLTGMVTAWQTDLLTRLDLIESHLGSNQTKLDAASAQLARIIAMLLDLFPSHPSRPAIKANLLGGSIEGTQTAPSPSGP